MRKFGFFFTAAMLTAGCFSMCAFGDNQAVSDNREIRIVTTIFPEYDWVMNVLGENPADAEVTMLLDSGVDLHSYQPAADDILKISTCDLFIYVGGESDEWVNDALQERMNEDMVIIDLLDVLGTAVREEELVEGMQEDAHEHAHGHEEDEHGHEEDEHDHEEDENAGAEYDEHVWLSLRNAAVLVQSISEALQIIDPDYEDAYERNSAGYIEKLNALDADYQAAVSGAKVTTLLFGDRFPFRYLTDDYGLAYYAAFAGCSAETEASFETITFLAQKVDELDLHAIMTIEGTSHRIAETIRQNTSRKDQEILTLDSMQSITAKDIQNGTTYLSVMESNLSVLQAALK